MVEVAGTTVCRVLLLACLLCALWSGAAVADETPEKKEEEDTSVSEMTKKVTELLKLAKEVKVETDKNCAKCGELAADAKGVAAAAEKVVKTSKKAVEAHRDAKMSQSAHGAALLATAAQAVRGNAVAVEHTARRIMAVPEVVGYLKKAEDASLYVKGNAAKLEKELVELLKNAKLAEKIEKKMNEMETPVVRLQKYAALAKTSTKRAIKALKVDKMGAAVNKAEELNHVAQVVVNQTEKVKNIFKAANVKAEEKEKALKDALERLKELASELKTIAIDAKEAQNEAEKEAEGLTTDGPPRAVMQATKLLEEATNMVKLEALAQKAVVKEGSDMAEALRNPPSDAGFIEEETRANDGSHLTPFQFVAPIVLSLLLACVVVA